MQSRDEPQPGADRISGSRAELESLLVGNPNSPFPRSHTMRFLRSTGPMWLTGVALGLMIVRPRWGTRLLRLVPMARAVKRIPI